MPGLYTHTTRTTGTTLTAAIYNADHQNHIDNHIPTMIDDHSATVGGMQATTTPGGVGSESLPTSLAGEIERLRYVLKTLHGGAQWYPGVQLVAASGGTLNGGTLTNVAHTTQTLTDAATISWDHASGQAARVTLTASGHTLANPTNLKAGGHGFIDVIQDGTGNRTMLFGSNYRHVLGITPTLSTAAGARDRFYWSSFDGTIVDLTHAKGMA